MFTHQFFYAFIFLTPLWVVSVSLMLVLMYKDDRCIPSFCRFLTDEGGFEPPIPFIVCRFSKPVPSTTQTLTPKSRYKAKI